jgi:putative glycosyltransferase (TIGR04372 family)
MQFKSHYILQIRFEIQRIYKLSLKVFICKVFIKLAEVGFGIVLLPITILMHWSGFRFVNVFSDRIGHLALEPDTLLKAQALGYIKRRKWIILGESKRLANDHLLEYWRKYFIVLTHPLACFIVRSMVHSRFMKYDITKYLRAPGKTQEAYEIQRAWGDRRPLLELTQSDVLWGKDQLKSMGLPNDAWFVCVHVREEGFSQEDDKIQGYRNGDINKVIPAIEEIINCGGWVIRIGDSSMKRLPKMPNVVDYAHSPIKSARLDVVLCACARFILGNTSGISLVGTVFGIPCALANIVPISVLWFLKTDLSIPKLHWSRCQNRYLRLDELFESEMSTFQFSSQFEESGIVLHENSQEDIVNLVREMIDQLDGRFNESPCASYLQAYVKSMYKKNRHYGYNSAANMASSFLCNHPELLGVKDSKTNSIV